MRKFFQNKRRRGFLAAIGISVTLIVVGKIAYHAVYGFSVDYRPLRRWASRVPEVIVIKDYASYSSRTPTDLDRPIRPPISSKIPALTEADFEQWQAVYIGWGAKSCTGHSVAIDSVRRRGETITIDVRTTHHQPCGAAITDSGPGVALAVPKCDNLRIVVQGDRERRPDKDITASTGPGYEVIVQ